MKKQTNKQTNSLQTKVQGWVASLGNSPKQTKNLCQSFSNSFKDWRRGNTPKIILWSHHHSGTKTNQRHHQKEKLQLKPTGSHHFFYFAAKSCLTLAMPWSVPCQAPLSMGFPRQEDWSGLPFYSPGDLPTQGSNSHHAPPYNLFSYFKDPSVLKLARNYIRLGIHYPWTKSIMKHPHEVKKVSTEERFHLISPNTL